MWYHSKCMFEVQQRARAATKKIETPADLDGFGDLKDDEKDDIKQYIKGTGTLGTGTLDDGYGTGW